MKFENETARLVQAAAAMSGIYDLPSPEELYAIKSNRYANMNFNNRLCYG